MSVIPASWLPDLPVVKHIVIHWTAGGHTANSKDKASYHFLVEGDGKVVRGDHSVTDNIVTGDNKYAAHTLGLNTNTIGVSMCSMAGAKESPLDYGSAPFTEVQWNTLAKVVAQLCERYNVKLTNKTVLSHAEVQGTLGVKQKNKWDITVIPFIPTVKGATAVGNLFRQKVAGLMGTTQVVVETKTKDDVTVAPSTKSALVDIDLNVTTKQIQQALIKLGYNIIADDIIGNKTISAIKMLQKTYGFTANGRIGPKTAKVLFG